MTAVRLIVIVGIVAMAAACQSGRPAPATLEPGVHPCHNCRMIVVDRHFASQIVAPYEAPKFFDDLGCLGKFLKANPLAANAEIYVADHRSEAWVPAGRAVYTRVESISAPMGSHVLAHESTSSRDADPVAAGGTSVALNDALPVAS